jgi:hypothetical protein
MIGRQLRQVRQGAATAGSAGIGDEVSLRLDGQTAEEEQDGEKDERSLHGSLLSQTGFPTACLL